MPSFSETLLVLQERPIPRSRQARPVEERGRGLRAQALHPRDARQRLHLQGSPDRKCRDDDQLSDLRREGVVPIQSV